MEGRRAGGTAVTRTEQLLTAAEELALARAVEAGLLARDRRMTGAGFGDATPVELRLIEIEGERARRRLVTSNLALVGLVVRETVPRGLLPEPDLFQEGCLGLATAALRYDHARPVRFATYALYWIRAHVGAAAASQFGALNLPASRAEELRVARRRETELSLELGRAPTVEELAARLDRPVEWTRRLIGYERPRSLDGIETAAVASSAETVVLDGLRDDRGLTGELLRRLDDLERRVLEHRFGFADGKPHSFVDTAQALGINATRVLRVERRALDRLRALCPADALAGP